MNDRSAAKIFHNVITHNRGTNPVTIMLRYNYCLTKILNIRESIINKGSEWYSVITYFIFIQARLQVQLLISLQTIF